MIKRSNAVIKLLWFSVIIVFVASCNMNIGLGDAVDTTAPTISISSPQVSAVLANQIVVEGVAHDDIDVQKVFVKLRGINNNLTFSKDASFDPITGAWNCTFITKESIEESIEEAGIPDGKYEIVATAKDNDGKTSTVTNTVVIDNTPPSVIVVTPRLYNENRTTAFIKVDVSGSAFDANEIKNVKIYFCKYDSQITLSDITDNPDDTEILTEIVKSFKVDGTSTWNFSKELNTSDLGDFFKNDEEYSFWVVAEDVAGNKNEYFYRNSDFYNILESSNESEYKLLPALSVIGGIDQGTISGGDETRGITADKLKEIKRSIGNAYVQENNRNEQDLVSFTYKKQADASVVWQNITPTTNTNSAVALALNTPIIGLIKSSDTSAVLPDTVVFYIKNKDDNSEWELPIVDGKDAIQTVSDNLSFSVYPKKSATNAPCESGNYIITVKYKTEATKDRETPLSDSMPFGISAGAPVLEETALYKSLYGEAKSPMSLDAYLTTSFTMQGIATKGDGKPAPSGEVKITRNNEPYTLSSIGENGEWSITVDTEGENKFSFSYNDTGLEAFLYRTIIIDSTAPQITINELQSSDGNSVTIAGVLTEDNPETIEYAFVKKDTAPADADWISPKGVFNWKDTIDTSDKNIFTEGIYTLHVKASDKAGNVKTETKDFVLDRTDPIITPNADLYDKTHIVKAGGTFTLEGSATDTLALDKVVISAKHDNGDVVTWHTETMPENASGDTLKTLSWSKALEINAENQGNWTFTVEAFDKSGRKSATKTTNVTLDITAPVFGFDEDEPKITTIGKDGWFGNTTLTIVGTLTENIGIDRIECSVDNGTTYEECSYKKDGTTYTITAKPSFGGEVLNGTVTLRATDSVGNETTKQIPNIKIDTSNPELSILAPTDTPLLNGNNDLVITVNATDSASGINAVKAKIGSNDFSTDANAITGTRDGETNNYTVTISANKIPATPLENSIYIQATDNAGNSTVVPLRYLIDSTAPSVAISSHTNGSKVNKTITVSGTASDSQGLSKVELFASVDGGVNYNSIYTETANPYVWSKTINTTSYADGATLKLKAVATDEAGNIAIQEIAVTVDQNSDRPVIRLTEIQTDGNYYLNNTASFNGTIEDDDGVEQMWISQNGTTWNEVTVKNGVSWNYTLTSADGQKVNGAQTVYFKVKDKAGTTFATNAAQALLKPYLADETTETFDGVLTFAVDQSRPEIDSNDIRIFYTAPNSATLTQAQFDAADVFANNQKLGGAKDEFYLAVKATDENGISSVSAYFTENSQITATKATKIENVYVTNKIDVSSTSGIADGVQSLSIKVLDNAGNDSEVTKSIIVDNTAPTASIISHTNGEQVTADVIIRGESSDASSATDTSGVYKVYYMIPKKSEASTITANSAGWNETTGVASWYVEFTTGTNGQLKQFANTTYGTNNGYNVWTIPIYLKIEDNAGNVNIQKNFELKIDPDGDRPITTIIDPVNGATLGGSIRLFGTATDNVRVDAVYVQLDINHDGVFNNADKTLLTSNNPKYANYKTKVETFTDVTGASTWGIKVDGTTTWNFTINGEGELNQDNLTTYKIRACSKDNNGLFGLWTDEVSFDVDKNSPKFGDASNPIKLVQYSDNINGTGAIVATKDYISGDWISGKWWLTTKVHDDSGIKNLSLQESTPESLNSSIVKDGVTQIANNISGIETVGTNHNYIIKIPIDTNSFPSNSTTIEFKLYAEDNDNPTKSGTYQVALNYDNTAPVLDDLLTSTSDGKKYGDGNNNTAIIEQSNYSVEFASIATDSGSGFDKAVVYFMRGPTTENGTDAVSRIYMPQEPKDENRTDLVASSAEGKLAIEDGLPRLTVTGTLGTSTFTSNSLKNNKNIRVGGLVTILGVERTITSVANRDSSGEIAFTPAIDSAQAGSNKTVKFVYGLVIDNFTVETPKRNKVGELTNIIGDDGDGVIESIQKSGGSYTWSVSIDSKNIPDGPLSVCVVAYDKSGNKTAVQQTETSVMNNRPTIAKIFLGTDLNANGTIETQEETVFNDPTIFTPDGFALSEIDLDATSAFKAVGITHIRPEIVGGNGALYYYGYKTKYVGTGDNAVATADTTKPLSTAKGVLRTGGEGSTINPIMLNYASDAIEGFTDETGGQFFFKIFDSTEGLATNQADPDDNKSQWATMAVSMNIDVVDEVKPVAVIDNFFWNGHSDNSLYKNSTANGHIELEADLPADFNQASGIRDRDPKVSGKISIRGSAYDDIRLTALYLRFDDFTFTGITGAGNTRTEGGKTYYKLATYSNGTWNGTGDASLTNGWHFTVENEYQGQTGHRVNWQLDIDTSKISGVAGLDKVLRIIALDGRSTPNVSATTAATSDESVAKYNKPSYQMDVVPYITSLTTFLSNKKRNNPSVYARTALGHYPVYTYVNSGTTTTSNGESETFTVNGFNLGTTSTVSVGHNRSSGEYTVTTNSVTSLNNSNNNEAEYNKQPNNDNNNLLTDDVILDVWQFNNSAAKPISGIISDPVMKVNPSSGQIGFAFTNGPLYFSMAGNVAGNSRENNQAGEYSYFYWQGSYDFMKSIGFAYDSTGHTYGCAAGGDINSTEADKFSFMTDRWGVSGAATTGSYGGSNANRLEIIAQAGDSSGGNTDTIYFDKDRIMSPSYATYRNGNSTNIYLAYYDHLNGELRFRSGTLNDNTSKSTFGNFRDSYTTNAVKGNQLNNGKYDITRVQVLANEGSSVLNANARSGEYVSIATVPSNGYVVMVWYDSVNQKLWYSYNTNPTANTTGNAKGNWSNAVEIMDEAGEYCQIAVDASGGIHIAAYDGIEADLKYAYFSAYDQAANAQVCTVDSYAIVGQNITLDVARKTANGKYVPYIGYYALSSAMPKFAYLVDGIDSSTTLQSGVNTNEEYTQAWEITLLPTKSRTFQDRVNVAVWKTNEGVLKNSVTGTSSANTNWGKCYGNGTSNGVLAYAIKQSSTVGYIETAQMK